MRWVEADGRRVRWAPYQADWRRIVDWALAAAERGDPIGFDTEFHGADLRKESPVGRVHVHVWSLGLLTSKLHPRGNRIATGFALPADALHDAHVAGLLGDPDVIKVAHNSPVDYHSAGNAGVVVRGLVNSLSSIRWVMPWRKDGPGFGLKAAMDLVGRKPFAEYKDLMKEEYLHETAKVRTRRVCSCGVAGCRKRKGHVRQTEQWTEYVGELRSREVPLQAVGPGHHLWNRLRVYAAEDAEAAVELWDLLRRLGKRRPVHNPFFKEQDGGTSSHRA